MEIIYSDDAQRDIEYRRKSLLKLTKFLKTS